MKNIFIFTFCILLFTLIGCNQSEELTKEDKFLLTSEDVVNTILDNDLILIKNNKVKNDVYKLHETSPNIFTLENNETLLIYVFNDIEKRKEVEYDLFGRNMNELFDEKNFSFGTLVAKNVLLLYTVSDNSINEPNSNNIIVLNKLRSIVFEKLNDGKELLYSGSGEYWEGEILVKYYFHMKIDENGILNIVDSCVNESGEIHFIGNVDDVSTPIEFVIEGNSNSLSCSKSSFDKDGYIDFKMGGSTNVLQSKVIYTATINWNNQVETFEFNPE